MIGCFLNPWITLHLNTDGMSNYGEVFAGSLNLGLSDGQNEITLKDLVVNLEGNAVHQVAIL
jgi:hypothetical protein